MVLKRSTGPMMKRREGFTLIELLTVMVIMGLLAALGMWRFWAVKERSYWAALKSDLRGVVIQQEEYFSRHMTYANDPSLLTDLALSPGVSITITYAGVGGWAANAEHSSLSPKKCGYFQGDATAASAPPATTAGEIKCDE